MPAGTEFVSLKMSISRAFLSSLEREAICEMMRERQTNTHQFIYEGSPPFTDVVSETEERSGDLSDTSPSLLETPEEKMDITVRDIHFFKEAGNTPPLFRLSGNLLNHPLAFEESVPLYFTTRTVRSSN